ncbi:MAG: hypothetical protein LBB60_04135 [Desulfovibrio sp.]|jgi:hypothetical protein|nr:hypothetical protein [Desulfovibrio sp.]
MPDAYALPIYFNIAGPCIPERHYMTPALARLPEAQRLALEGHYFVIHAARQSGKTTLLQALTNMINAQDKFYALYCSLESLQGVSEPADGINGIFGALRQAIVQWSPVEAVRAAWPESVFQMTNTIVSETLSRLSALFG